jgi:hypothetical protein
MVITNESLEAGMLCVVGMEICVLCTEFHGYIHEVGES